MSFATNNRSPGFAAAQTATVVVAAQPPLSHQQRLVQQPGVGGGAAAPFTPAGMKPQQVTVVQVLPQDAQARLQAIPTATRTTVPLPGSSPGGGVTTVVSQQPAQNSAANQKKGLSLTVS
jgi:hypothetical protein